MRTNKSLPKPLMLAASAMVWCGLNLHAQSGPTITTQPASQTNLPGTSVSFSVGVSGTGPLGCQWQFNGTNFPNNIITTVAGNGSATQNGGYSADGGEATNATLNNPVDVAFDACGNLFIADSYDNRIRKVDTNGIITTVAGSGPGGLFYGSYFGDGGAATNASLNAPYGVAFDAFGNLYFADYNNSRIRKVDTNGIITTVAGNGSATYAGDGGAATNASLSKPSGVAFDTSGNLFIADCNNQRIRKVDTNGFITTVAGKSGSGYSGDGGAATNANFNGPTGVAFDASGNLFITDKNNNRIRKVDTNGIITSVAGKGSGPFGSYSGDGGAATNAGLFWPGGAASDNFGNLIIADTDNNRIRKVDTQDIITTVAGKSGSGYSGDGGAATNASLHLPDGVAFDASGNMFIADYSNQRIRKVLLYAGYPAFTLNNIGVTNAGNYTVVVTSPYGSVTSVVATLTVAAPGIITSQPASQLEVIGSSPSFSVEVAGSGPFDYEWYLGGTNLVQSGTNNTLTLPNVSTNNAGNYTVEITNNYGSVTSQVATLLLLLPIQPTSLTNLAGTSVTFNTGVNETGPFSYQWQFNGTNLEKNIITTVAGNGSATYSGDGGAATNASLWNPTGVAFDANGNLFIADFGNDRIRKVDTNGIIATVAGNDTNGYSGDGGAATNAILAFPKGVAFDASGNLFIADWGNSRIRKVDTDGIITTVAGDGTNGLGDGGAATNASLNLPYGVGCDASGNLFIADTINNRIRKVNTNGIITTVAGNGNATQYGGYSSDGGGATNATLNNPEDVAFDANGNMFIADNINNRIRKVDTNGIITTVAGIGPGGLFYGSYFGDGGTATHAGLSGPTGVAFDGYGNMFIADWQNDRIRKVDTNGIITTVAGNGTLGYSGDGGAAINATLRRSQRVACDASGNLFIADSYNNCIRKVHFAGDPTLTLNNIAVTNAGNYSVVITSLYGSVTSLVASLTVIVPPQIIASGTNFGFTTNLADQFGFGFNLNGTSNQTIVVDGSTNLLDWTPLYTNIANGIPAYFFDPASTNYPGRFYRLRLQ